MENNLKLHRLVSLTIQVPAHAQLNGQGDFETDIPSRIPIPEGYEKFGQSVMKLKTFILTQHTLSCSFHICLTTPSETTSQYYEESETEDDKTLPWRQDWQNCRDRLTQWMAKHQVIPGERDGPSPWNDQYITGNIPGQKTPVEMAEILKEAMTALGVPGITSYDQLQYEVSDLIEGSDGHSVSANLYLWAKVLATPEIQDGIQKRMEERSQAKAQAA